jgi:hypothetical protein
MRDAHRCHPDSTGKLSLRDTSVFEDFPEKIARVNRGQATLDHEALRSMIVDDLDVISVTLCEPEADSPLIVDSNAPLAFAIALERLESI